MKRGRETGRKEVSPSPLLLHFLLVLYFSLTILSLKVAIFTYKFKQDTNQVRTLLFNSKALTDTLSIAVMEFVAFTSL